MTGYVGVDLHRRRSVIVVLDSDGTELWTRRIDNDPVTLGLRSRRRVRRLRWCLRRRGGIGLRM
jgi:hypothetical protein